MSSNETLPLHREEERKSQTFFLANITVIARIFGLVTLIVMWISAVVLIDDDKGSYAGYYLIGASIVVTFFEITWILDKFACCVREGCCCRIWSVILWVDNWKKFILYIVLSVPLFLEGMRMVLGIVTGILMVLLSLLYLAKTFRFLMVFLSVLYLVKTFRSHVSIKYEKTERRVTSTSGWQVVRHETSTQTDLNDQQVLSTTTTMSSSSSATAP